MRELRCVGRFTDDDATSGADGARHDDFEVAAGQVLVAEVDGDEQFRLVIDDALRTAIAAPAANDGQSREARPFPPASTPTTAPGIGGTPAGTPMSPREIQRRVRAGEEPQAVAEHAELPIERILLFAGPVLEERERIIGEARRGRANRASGAVVIFGEAVDGRFSAHGIDPSVVRWDAWRQEDEPWQIAAFWRGGDADRVARWSFALAARTVSALDETAADLLSDRPIRPVTPPVAPSVALAAPRAAADPASTDAPAAQHPAADPASTGTPAAQGPGADPASTGAPAADRGAVDSAAVDLAAVDSAAGGSPASALVETRADGGAALTTHASGRASDVGPDNGVRPDDDTGPLPTVRRARRSIPSAQPSPDDSAQRLAASSVSPPLPLPFGPQLRDRSVESALSATTPSRRGSRRQQPLIAGLRAEEETDEQRAARARVPSWDDIMLGVRRKRD
jgi:Protein of unknown function (DUF3071)